MKKIFLSFSLAALFAGYMAYQRIVGLGGNNMSFTRQLAGNNAPYSAVPASPAPEQPAINPPLRVRYGEGDLEESDDSSFRRVTRNQVAKTSAPVINPTPALAPAPAVPSSGLYRNGTYTSAVTDAYYGNVQIKVTIAGGKISDVQFLDYPQDRSTSVRINNYAMPILTNEAIQAQSANVDAVSGATATSGAFTEALTGVLAQAKN